MTRQFYAAGWRGLNLEPVPAYYGAMALSRTEDINLQVAAGAAPGTLTFHIVRDTGLSTLRDDIAATHLGHGHQVDDLQVSVVPLDTLIEAHLADQEIHFLKVDVEGAEAAVLAGIDLVRHRPWVLVIEATLPQTTEPTHDGWEPSLLERGYVFCMFDGLSRWYVAQEHHATLGPALSYPACVLDEYLPLAAFHAMQRAEQADRKAELWRDEALEHAVLERNLQIQLLDIHDELITRRDDAYQLTVAQAEMDNARWQAGLLERERDWLRDLVAEHKAELAQAQERLARARPRLVRAAYRSKRALRRLSPLHR